MNNKLRKMVIVVFFLGMALMAGLELGLTWALEGGFNGNNWQISLALAMGGGGLGLAVCAGSWAVFGLVLIIFTALICFIYVHESRELTKRFGVEYQEYCRTTPFFFPRFPS